MQRARPYLVALTLSLFAILLLAPSQLSSKEMTAKDLVAEASASVKTVSLAEAKESLGKGGVVFLDVREDKEFKSGHIPGAMHLSRGMVEFQIDKKIPDKNIKIFIYCKTGGRASLAAANLIKMGYKNIVNIEGGWDAWMKAGYPVE
jgi:rhodanese-related sulfurtransferase